jgi:hypothetical protein
MTRYVAVALVLLSLAVAEAEARSRAVRHPAPVCSFSLSSTFGTTVASAGLSRAALNVTANPSTCTSWNAYSLTSWVTVERSGNVVFVDVAPNPTSTPRLATILVAGVQYSFSQEASPVVSPPIAGNILQNSGFDTDLTSWGWQDRFPNGNGIASWSTDDAKGNANSGSIRLRNTQTGLAFQQLQCVAVESSRNYSWGGTIRASSSTAGAAVLALFEYADANCENLFTSKVQREVMVNAPMVWQTQTYTRRMASDTKSVLFLIASASLTASTFDVWVDDVFLIKQ